MIYGRSLGESFGLSIAEFSILNKPIFLYSFSRHRSHYDFLSSKRFKEYNSKSSLLYLLNNDQLNLDKNLRKLDRIEKSIYKNTTRNYWMTAILISSIFISIIIYLRVEQIHLEAIYWITGILSIIIIVMRPKKNNGK